MCYEERRKELPMMNPTADTAFWDKAAARYAAAPIKDMVGYERTIERTAELLMPTDSVLELGCGTGTTALQLARHVRAIHGTDISEEMIAIARRKAEAEASSNVSFTTTPAHSPHWPEHDAVLAFNLLHLVSDRQAVLRQTFKALKPGGLFISKTPCLSEMNPLIRLAVPLMRVIGKAPDVSFFTGDDLERDIAEAGFGVIERGRHGSRGKDPRIFIVARKPISNTR
jgi:2-polyprenyl-3-methyl-5-hydroxy-6-metoxy-1,4-benzoquinol methylase